MPSVTVKPEPYDPCYCNSGKKYKFCHYLLDRTPASDKRRFSQKMYVEKWIKNTGAFSDQGCYVWMASILKAYSPNLILDVGCGDGSGIVALKTILAPKARIVSCDDNPLCLKATYKKIQGLGMPVQLVERLEQTDSGPGYFTMRAVPNRLVDPLRSEVSLIEADAIWDKEFHEFLEFCPRFDAITIWLIGTYDYKPQCTNLPPSAKPHYRLTVQNKIYELADKILRIGGVLQIVDRGEIPEDDAHRQDTINAHKEQAQGTNLEVVDHQFRAYTEPPNGSATPMVVVPGKSGRMKDKFELAMISIVSVKR